MVSPGIDRKIHLLMSLHDKTKESKKVNKKNVGQLVNPSMLHAGQSKCNNDAKDVIVFVNKTPMKGENIEILLPIPIKNNELDRVRSCYENNDKKYAIPKTNLIMKNEDFLLHYLKD